MQRFSLILIAVVALAGSGARGGPEALDDAAKARAIAAELAKFEGTWKYISMTHEGRALPVEALAETRLILKGSEFTMKSPRGDTPGSFKIDPTARPKTIEVTFLDGPYKGDTLLGIYELSDDTYRVCMGVKGKALPTEFVSQPGSGLSVLKRETP